MNKMEYEKWFAESEPELLEKFYTFLRFQSFSCDPSHAETQKKTASWLTHELQSAGFTVQELEKESIAPIVFAEYLDAGKDKPTLLIYNHYDIQPVDPIDEWDSDPFEPRKDGSEIYARGAQDNKGQCFYVLFSLITMLKKTKALPINIKLIIEGQEESGSDILSKLLDKNPAFLKSDYLLVADLGMRSKKRPAITLGCRGIVCWSVICKGAHSDLHSGVHGGLLYNPLHAVAEIVAKLRDENGKITVPGFYDNIETLNEEEKAKLSFHFDNAAYEKETGKKATGGEKALAPSDRAWLRPTLEVNGIVGGYGGPGSKTVIAKQCVAKLSSRIVPGQNPLHIAKIVKEYIESLAPEGIDVQCEIHEGMGKPLRTSPESHFIKALYTACKKVYKTDPEFILEGATIPIAADLQKASKSEVALFGLGLNTDNIHAPNEHFGWDRVKNGFCIILTLLETLSETLSKLED